MTNSSLPAKCVFGYTYPFSKITYTLTSLLTSLAQFFRAVWAAVSGAIVLRKSPNKTETHSSHVVHFFSSVDIWFMFILVSVIEWQVLQWQFPWQTHGPLFPSNTTLFCFLVFIYFFCHVPQHVTSLSPASEVQNLNQWATREVPQKHFVMRLCLFGSWNVPIINL